ncbi:MAG TPA: threonine synthase [Candidatus Acidoferrales bacterium]|nr:threonine synthase [Candidatus Acidoferrales bacterium]
METTARTSSKIVVGAVQRCITRSCGAAYGLTDRVYVCSGCGGPLEIEIVPGPAVEPSEIRERWRLRATSSDVKDRSGVWRFRELLPFDPDVVVTLLEGNTPLYDAPRCAEYCGLAAVRLKHQGCNPTGSFKDTGMTVAVTHARLLGAETAVCASTGNTAASLAAYSARAVLQCAILLPFGQISASKLAQSMDYGATICEIDGNFDDCMRLVLELGDDPSIYVANSVNPFRIEGQKTVAFELMEQCGWRAPNHVVVPGGNLGNSSALGKGFNELLALGLIDRLPKLHVIQAEGSAPFARLFADLKSVGSAWDDGLPEGMASESRPRTLATAIKIGAPVSWKKSLRAVLQSGGEVTAVTEQEIADAKAMVGRDGIGCEPASATTIAGIRRLVANSRIRRDESVIAILTGHVLKDPDYVSNYHRGTLSLAGDEREGRAEQKIVGAFRNRPERIAANKPAILERLKSRKR